MVKKFLVLLISLSVCACNDFGRDEIENVDGCYSYFGSDKIDFILESGELLYGDNFSPIAQFEMSERDSSYQLRFTPGVYVRQVGDSIVIYTKGGESTFAVASRFGNLLIVLTSEDGRNITASRASTAECDTLSREPLVPAT